MRALMIAAAFAVAVAFLAGRADRNAHPTYSDEGDATNCRAYVSLAIADYQAKIYTAEETMAALQRNCGLDGQLWTTPDT